MKPLTKVVVVVLALAMVGFGIYGTLLTDLSFDYKVIGADDTVYVRWIVAIEKYFPFGNLHIDIVLDDEKADYTSSILQKQFVNLDNIISRNKYFEAGTVNWMTAFMKWRGHHNFTNETFYGDLDIFLAKHKDFKRDLIFNSDRKILASRIHTFTKRDHTWLFRKEAMLSIRKDLKEKAGSFYPITFEFVYASSLVIIIEDTVTNVSVCSLVILLITLPYVVNPIVSLLLLLTFVCFILELLAVMFLWNLSLNLITMIVMTMAIGFTVDYSCHITYAYLISNKDTPEKRIVDSMAMMGISILKGGM